MAYLSVADLKRYLDIDDDSKDALLTVMLNTAQQAVDTHCRRTFGWDGAATVRYFDAERDVSDRRLWLDKDCIAVTAVVNGDGSSIAAGSYILEPRNYAADGERITSILLKSGSGLRWTHSGDPEGAISVTGKWAYSLTPPDDVVQATRRMAGYLFAQKDNAGDLDRPMYGNTALVTLPPKLPDDVIVLLRPYIRRTVRH